MASVTSRTAASKAAVFAADGLALPLTFRTYCRAADYTSSGTGSVIRGAVSSWPGGHSGR